MVGIQWTGGSTLDPDAAAYIAAVEVADGQALEAAVKTAIDALIVGIKADGDWAGIVSLNVLNHARTLAGVAVSMKGAHTITYVNIVAGDLVRGLGLLGNGVDKYINTGVPRNSYGSTTSGWMGVHISDWRTRSGNANQSFIGVTAASGDSTRLTVGGVVPIGPTSANSSLVGRLWSTGSLIGVAIGGTGFGADVPVSVARNDVGLVIRTYPPAAPFVVALANAAATANGENQVVMTNLGPTSSDTFLSGTMAAYVFGNGGSVNADRVIPRLVAFTAALRAFFGN